MDAVATAGGVARVVEEVMAGAIRKVSLEQGSDPRTATLVAFGGAGGLHATALARSLDMAGVLVPLHAGVFSALGLLVSPPRVDVAQSRPVADGPGLDALAAEIADRAAARLVADTGDAPADLDVLMDVRYRGQSHEVAVPYRPGEGWEVLAARFHGLHAERNGFARPDDPIEVVTGRAEAVGIAAVDFASVPVPGPDGEAFTGTRPVVTDGGLVDAAVVRRPGLAPGDEIVGPAVIEEQEATTYLASGEHARVHDSGAL